MHETANAVATNYIASTANTAQGSDLIRERSRTESSVESSSSLHGDKLADRQRCYPPRVPTYYARSVEPTTPPPATAVLKRSLRRQTTLGSAVRYAPAAEVYLTEESREIRFMQHEMEKCRVNSCRNLHTHAYCTSASLVDAQTLRRANHMARALPHDLGLTGSLPAGLRLTSTLLR